MMMNNEDECDQRTFVSLKDLTKLNVMMTMMLMLVMMICW